ncbi:hairy-related 5 [Centroberyx gerrardi]|uniref:hairy-related 5 n=1 Tax=Centroberyx gerrardi TaxID=166262 RepID=UPI003AAB2B4D
MKTITSVFPGQKDAKRVPKPLMEKRRRDRINHSLETLRLLLLENTRNEKLKNPKVEKAEILESVVNFLKTETGVEKEHRAMKRVLSREQRPPCQRQHTYREGMRSCLLRVSHFISSKSQELEEGSGDAAGSLQASLGLPDTQTHPASPGQIHRALLTTSACDPAALSAQHLPLRHPQLSLPYMAPGLSGSTQRTDSHCDHDTRKLLSPKSSMDISDPVWRPWPQ